MPPDPIVAGLPADALVLLVGPSGCGKSTWAATRFPPSTVLSSDAFRELVAGDAADQGATAAAFRALHGAASARLRRGLPTVIDATNLGTGARRSLRHLADSAGRPVVAIAFDLTLARCLAQNATRPGRRVPDEVIRRHRREMDLALARLPHEGYAMVHRLSEAEVPPA